MTRPLIFGILNVTPDSFSDGGQHADPDAAVAHALGLVAEGSNWIDVGGESTAPSSTPVDAVEERARVLPVVERLVAEGVPVSIDTYHASTAAAAVAAGAGIVNDVYGTDPDMPRVVRDSDAHLVVMHSFGPPTTPHTYRDVVAEVRDELLARVDRVLAAGVRADRIILDPGIGFSKAPKENWDLLAGLERIASAGYPVLVGASRKRFLGGLVGPSMPDRDLATAVISAGLALAGAWAVRVHDVRATRVALDVAGAWLDAHAEAYPQGVDA